MWERRRWRLQQGPVEETGTEDEVAMLDRLLDLPDNELWDILAGREQPADASVAPLVAALRDA